MRAINAPFAGVAMFDRWPPSLLVVWRDQRKKGRTVLSNAHVASSSRYTYIVEVGHSSVHSAREGHGRDSGRECDRAGNSAMFGHLFLSSPSLPKRYGRMEWSGVPRLSEW